MIHFTNDLIRLIEDEAKTRVETALSTIGRLQTNVDNVSWGLEGVMMLCDDPERAWEIRSDAYTADRLNVDVMNDLDLIKKQLRGTQRCIKRLIHEIKCQDKELMEEMRAKTKELREGTIFEDEDDEVVTEESA